MIWYNSAHSPYLQTLPEPFTVNIEDNIKILDGMSKKLRRFKEEGLRVISGHTPQPVQCAL